MSGVPDDLLCPRARNSTPPTRSPGSGTRFAFADDGPVYLDGNSLGRLPHGHPGPAARRVDAGVGRRPVRGWDRWIELAREVGDVLATGVLEASTRARWCSADSTSVNLYKLAVGRARRPARAGA